MEVGKSVKLYTLRMNMGNINTSEQYELVKKDYDAVADWYHERYDASVEFALQINDFMEALPESSKVLDIGAGTGKESALISRRAEVTALDISPVMVEKFRSIHPNIKAVVGNMVSLEFPENSFDGVWACRSIIHIPRSDLDKTLDGITRILKPNGVLGVIFIPSESSEFEEQYLPEPEVNDSSIVYYRNLYSVAFIRNLLTKSGLKIQTEMECEDADKENLYYIRSEKL